MKKKRVLSYTGLVIGALLLINGFTAGTSELLPSLLLAFAIGGPAAWWFHCEKKDQEYLDEHAQLAKTYEYLNEEDLRFLAPLEEPKKYDRKWKIVAPVAIAAFLLGGSLLPEQTGAAIINTTPVPTASTVLTSS